MVHACRLANLALAWDRRYWPAWLITTTLLAAPWACGDFIHQTLRSFGFADQMGENPQTAMIQASDGALYGIVPTYRIDQRGVGALFKLNANGTGYRVLHAFGAIPSDGQSAVGELMEGSDGALYGTTLAGGIRGFIPKGFGTVFRLNKDGSGYTIIHSFGSPPDGNGPGGALMEGNDGMLYGTTRGGGSNETGTRSERSSGPPP